MLPWCAVWLVIHLKQKASLSIRGDKPPRPKPLHDVNIRWLWLYLTQLAVDNTGYEVGSWRDVAARFRGPKNNILPFFHVTHAQKNNLGIRSGAGNQSSSLAWLVGSQATVWPVRCRINTTDCKQNIKSKLHKLWHSSRKPFFRTFATTRWKLWKKLVCHSGRSRVRDPMRWISSIYLILLAALGPGVYSASNRNEYQKQKNNIPWEKSAAGT
jgi:hypothetical protein